VKAPPSLAPELVAALRRLRLGRIADVLPERLLLADKQGLDFEATLLGLLTDEIARRQDAQATTRAEQAGLDPDMTFERFDKASKVTYDKRLLTELSSLRFVDAGRHALLLGPVGVGKTFVSTALGHLACRHGYSVHFTRADRMLHTMRKSRFDNSRDAVMRSLCTVDLLILDDFALEPLDRDESRDVYQLFVERTGRASMIVTSNRDTAEWLAMFDDPLLGQSAVDRFKNGAYDLVLEGESYRPHRKPSVRENDPPPSAPVAKRPGGRRRRR
jgi:DNA replication protein DnaC